MGRMVWDLSMAWILVIMVGFEERKWRWLLRSSKGRGS